MSSFLSWPDDRSRRRLWRLYHVVFVLLAVHFVLIYVWPSFLINPRTGRARAWSEPGPMPYRQPTLIERDGRMFLWGGENDHEHFDVTAFRLDPDGLHYGLGREVFSALIKSEFVSVDAADQWLEDFDKVMLVRINGVDRVYPIRLLTRHEVVNDVVEGVPIFAAYCILADLGAIYDRRLGDRTLTFGVSGYTYADPHIWEGRDAFVLWDRETESLWWPPIGRAVSGPLIDQPLRLLDEALWLQTTWAQVKKDHPDAMVLKDGQDFERPTNWPKWDVDAGLIAQADQTTIIAPRWGDNAALGPSRTSGR